MVVVVTTLYLYLNITCLREQKNANYAYHSNNVIPKPLCIYVVCIGDKDFTFVEVDLSNAAD